jgi:tRNA G18 (ribose-2'-O)-methylase SpoU
MAGAVMTKRQQLRDQRGFFGIGIEHGKSEANLGTLWRSAYTFGASFVFTVGRRYKHQSSDTVKAWRHVPLYHYADFDAFHAHLPYDAQLIGVELDDRAQPLGRFVHPQRAVYLLGAEDHGLSATAMQRCHRLIVLPGRFCLNVSVAGSVVLYHRHEQLAGVVAA